MTRTEVFLDSSFAIALSTPRDINHSAALDLSFKLETPGSRVVTTRAVMVEIGDSMARVQQRRAAVALLAQMESDPNIEVLSLSEELYGKAFALFRDRPDKEWGLTDCISFLVMQERGITDALTADDHFRQAGFRPLLTSG